MTKIQLHYHAYGDPKDTNDLKWKQRHLDSWNRACKAAAKILVNLQHIDFWVYLSETTVRLNIEQPYLEPLSWFRKRKDPKKTIAKALTSVNVNIETKWNRPDSFTDKNLGWASVHLHSMFGEGVSQVILGATVEEGMDTFNYVWNRRYVRWQQHLQFAKTGW